MELLSSFWNLSSDKKISSRFCCGDYQRKIDLTHNRYLLLLTTLNESFFPDACGGLLSAPNGTITSPSFPDLYPPSKNCLWEILAPPQHRITLNFTHFDLEGNHMYQQVNLIPTLIYWFCLSFYLHIARDLPKNYKSLSIRARKPADDDEPI